MGQLLGPGPSGAGARECRGPSGTCLAAISWPRRPCAMATREIILEPHQEAIRPGRSRAKDINMGRIERWLTGMGGASLTILGLRRGSRSGVAAAVLGGALVERAMTGHCPAYAALGVSTVDLPRAVRLTEAVLVNRERHEVYALWRDFSQLPRFMTCLESVTLSATDDHTSHWVAHFPGLPRVEWDAALVEDEPGQRITWRSLEGSKVHNHGTVRFHDAPAGRGTVVEVWLEYEAPLGAPGASMARALRRLTSRRI